MDNENNDQPKFQHSLGNVAANKSNAGGDSGVGQAPPDNDDDNKHINLNDFLDLLNVSSVLNHCIMNMNSVPPGGSGAAGGSGAQRELVVSARSGGIDFNALADNRVVNELLGRSKRSKPTADPPAMSADESATAGRSGASASTLMDRSGGGGGGGSTTRALSTFGSSASAHYTRTHAAKKAGNADAAATMTSTTVAPTAIAASSGLHPKLEERLDYVINEGVLDSMLPYICPVPMPSRLTPRSNKTAAAKAATPLPPATATIAKANASTAATAEAPLVPPTAVVAAAAAPLTKELSVERPAQPLPPAATTTRGLAGRRKSVMKAPAHEKKEPEVVIHVCDEVKNTSRDFHCPQSLLVSKMGYFADVTAGQKLDDMDISVHCDIQIFDWLMRWVKSSAASGNSSGGAGSSADSAAGGPQLDAGNVVPILVSASFLQMEPLLLDCLSFCHARLSEVVRASANLSCLNDAIVSRLAAMFTNLELEAVRDKRDRVTPRLWTKLIQSLAEPETEALRGHYYTLCGLFRCVKCGKCVTHSTKSYVACVPGNMRLNRWGQLVSGHVRDSAWDVNVHVAQLFKELKSWRRVYWRLWGHCHALYCCLCEAHFPVHQLAWCRYHPEAPNFLGPSSEGRMPGPAGRYPCCGQQAFRFETLPGPSGCQFREHSVLVETDRERAIFNVTQVAVEGGVLYEPVPSKLQELVASGGDLEPRWAGMPLTPQRCRQGLLPPLNPDDSNGRLARRLRHGGSSAFFAASSSESASSDTDGGGGGGGGTKHRRRYAGGGGGQRAAGDSSSTATTSSGSGSGSSSDGCESEMVRKKTTRAAAAAGPKERRRAGRRHRRRGRPSGIPGRHWSGELSARSNQDHQREFEEKVMKQVAALVGKKTGAGDGLAQPTAPSGGTYLRLEAEWREQMKQRHGHGNANSGGGGGGGGAGGSNGGVIGNPTGAFSSNVSVSRSKLK